MPPPRHSTLTHKAETVWARIACFEGGLRNAFSKALFTPGANPTNSWASLTTSIYNASIVNFYNVTGSKACFENKNIIFYFEKRSSLLQRWRCRCKFKNRRIGSRFSRKNICTQKYWKLLLSFGTFTVMWYILCHLCVFCGHFVHFGMMYVARKIWQPW
jgi:hypothetical protein